MEVDAVETMLDRVAARDFKPERITADIAYGTGELLGAIVARNIAPHISSCSSPVRKATTPVRDQRAPTNSSAWAGAARACPRPAVARPASVGTVTNSHRVAPGGSPDAWQAAKLDTSIYRVFGEVEVAGWRAGMARPSVAVGFGGAVAGASG